MKLATIVAAAPTKQQLLDYQNACASVNLYAYAITATNLPLLKQPPKVYADFAEKFGPARATCLNWSGNIFRVMLEFPDMIVSNTADLFAGEDTLADKWLDILIDDPQNANAKKKLGEAIDAMQELIKSELRIVDGLSSSLDEFSKDITVDATALNTLAQQALTAAKADKAAIGSLNTDIAQLNKDIDALNVWITISALGVGASIFVGLIGVACCFIPGAQGLGVGLIVLAVGGASASVTGLVR
jgi:hypothetical protein